MRHGAGFVIAERDPAVNPPARCASSFAKSMARAASPLVATGHTEVSAQLFRAEDTGSAVPAERVRGATEKGEAREICG
jgi:hypothetical protein